ncbi:ATP-binding protein [Oleidesulfovibrio sp.]|uniref:ATP-binding protein n=1 Tax=Oleidesulfovibrio sp. TaxID=2909707 RepID=UPI003A89665A
MEAPRKSYRLFALLGLPLAIPLLLFTTLLLWWTYSKSVSLLNTELSQRFEQRHLIVSALFSAELERISQLLATNGRNQALIKSLGRLDREAVQDSLNEIQVNMEGNTLDILLVTLPDGKIFTDNGSPFYDIPEKTFINKPGPGISFERSIYTLNGQTLLLATEQIVSPVSGKILGCLVGATVLNDNLSLLSAINDHTHSEAVAFFSGGQLMGAAVKNDDPLLLGILEANLPAASGYRTIILDNASNGLAIGYIPLRILDRDTPLVMALGTKAATLTGIRQTYMATIAGLLFFFAVFLVYAFIFIRCATYPALRRLLAYAEKIRDGKHDAAYVHGPVTEFNTLGTFLEDTVHQLRQSRLLMRNIVDSMPSVLIAIDLQGNVIQWNMQAENVTGISKENASGRPLSAVFPRIAAEVDRIYRSHNTDAPSSNHLLSHIVDGEKRHESLTMFPLTGAGIHGAVILVDDITEHVQLEELLVQSEKMSSVSGLAAGMAHEINNPLAAILGYAQNLRKRLFADMRSNIEAAQVSNADLESIRRYMELRGVPRMIEGIIASGNRAASIVSNMLSFSRKSDKRFANYDMKEIMEKALELAANDYNLHKEYDFKKIEIIKDYADAIPMVHCEGNEIQQVLLNLLKNGAEAMSEKIYTDKHPQFTIRMHTSDGQVILEIEDNGPGITETTRKRIFEPFYTTKDVGKGTGLGLSVSYFIITEQHQGAMEVYSSQGNWTRFIIRLPVTPPPRKGTSLPVA